MPTKGHDGDAGWDLYTPVSFEVPAKGFSERINLLVGFEIPKAHAGLVIERSSQGKKGLGSVGPVVDHGYTGDVHVTLCNSSEEVVRYGAGDRVAQLVVVPVFDGQLELSETLEGERGDNGHGSTGA